MSPSATERPALSRGPSELRVAPYRPLGEARFPKTPAATLTENTRLMRCQQCAFDNRPGVSVCEQCGVKLGLACPGCGAAILLDRKFCGACGQSLTASVPQELCAPDSYTPRHLAEKILISRTALEGERKQITV